MGGDSAGANQSFQLDIRADQKVFIRSNIIMGFTTSFRMGQLLRYRLYIPPRKKAQELYDYMVTDFIDAVRNCLEKGGYARKEHGVESGGTFLIGIEGRLFIIYADFQVGESTAPYTACGCGTDIALGAMYVTGDIEPESRIQKALSAAERFSAGVRHPFIILKLEKVD